MKVDDRLNEIVGVFGGKISMCWEPKPDTQVFDSAQANKYVDEAVKALLQLIQEQRIETEKAFGGCKKCYGKGYSTVHEGQRSFDGSRYHETPKKTHIKYCSCERGKQLEQLTEEGLGE